MVVTNWSRNYAIENRSFKGHETFNVWSFVSLLSYIYVYFRTQIL